jgi:zeaxanthin glucosyltransferase
MSNIIIATQPTLSHLNPTLLIAKQLESHGHSVTYLTNSTEITNYVRVCGFRCRHIFLGERGSPRPQSLETKKASFLLQYFRAWREAQAMAEALTEAAPFQKLVEELSPDLLVIDSTISLFALPLAALGVPHIMISPVLRLDRDENVPPLTSNIIPSSTILSRIRCRLSWSRHLFSRAAVAFLTGECRCWSRVAAHYELESSVAKANRSWPAIRGAEIILCPSIFDFPHSSKENRFEVDSSVRPGSYEAGEYKAFAWQRLDSARPLVYCSFGSRVPAKSVAKRILNAIIEAFAGQTRFQLAVKVDSSTELSVFDCLPRHIVVVRDWVPQLGLLQRACAHITHAGFTSLRESIECEVPMLAMPFDSDQPGNAARIHYHGIGIRLSIRRTTGVRVLDLVSELVDNPSYKENIRRIRRAFELQRQQQSAADVIESMLTRRSSNTKTPDFSKYNNSTPSELSR